MRLLGTLIVALLAFTMAIFPISVPQAAASTGHPHATATAAGHTHAAFDGDHGHVHEPASSHEIAVDASADHGQGSHDCSGPVCCSMGTCHAFQAIALPDLFSPAASIVPVAFPGDEQVDGVTAGGLDKPPRTV
ncbi:hypothetical protein [Microvirga subterranea]|uniref:CopL family metal-binding regulatory protein n=1 Tax=Microvirga subterranea TaxID=186651 RepID=A0A370HIC7_9HYPH|nr:hypothetical protein [Microvirga subterranea]RDI57207.1 hypothetical protein DES45_107124 [Microvirga subterranea]